MCRVQTEYEGQAKKYMDVVDPTDAVITVGGDGTVSEVVSFHCQTASVHMRVKTTSFC